MATALLQTVTRQRVEQRVRTATRPSARQQDFDECSFGAFGSWSSGDIYLSGAKNHWQLARWMALNEVLSPDVDELWRLCIEANRRGFKRYRAMNLFDKSLNLRAGNVIFEYIEEPTQIPDNPPTVVIRRMLKAILAHRDSKLYCLEPVFKVADDEHPTLAVLPEIRLQAEQEQATVLGLYRRYRRMIQSWNWMLWKAGQAQESLGAWLERKSVKRELAVIRRRGAHALVGYAYEVEVLRRKELSDRAERLGLKEVARSLTASIENLRKIDPILSFTLPDHPNLHRFIGHWFWSVDRATGKPRLFVHV